MTGATRPRPARTLPLAPLLVLCAALSACATVPPGIRVARPEQVDLVAVRPLPEGWRRVAVLPFGGDPAHRRPAEELAAVTLRRGAPFSVLGPFGLQRRLGEAGAADLLVQATGWAPALVSGTGAEAWQDQLRALADAAGADALVLGWVAPGGASADLALLDPRSGLVVAALRRAGSPAAAERGEHELAMSATASALADLLVVLRTPPGVPPPVEKPAARSPPGAAP